MLNTTSFPFSCQDFEMWANKMHTKMWFAQPHPFEGSY